jgi:hypothetical protein
MTDIHHFSFDSVTLDFVLASRSMYGEQSFQRGLQIRKRQSIRAIGLGLCGIVVNFHEHAIDTDRHGSA